MTKRNIHYYNRTNTCDRCGDKLIPHINALREHNKEWNWTGRWICRECRNKDYYRETESFITNRRSGNQDPNSSNEKGDNFEELTCLWREIKRLSLEEDNYTLPIDHSKDPELGIVQTKGRLYSTDYRKWDVGSLDHEWFKEFDYMIFYCASADGKTIDRIYIFPWEEVLRRTSIGIYTNPARIGWYENYRVRDENVLRKVNKLWKEILSKYV